MMDGKYDGCHFPYCCHYKSSTHLFFLHFSWFLSSLISSSFLHHFSRFGPLFAWQFAPLHSSPCSLHWCHLFAFPSLASVGASRGKQSIPSLRLWFGRVFQPWILTYKSRFQLLLFLGALVQRFWGFQLRLESSRVFLRARKTKASIQFRLRLMHAMYLVVSLQILLFDTLLPSHSFVNFCNWNVA